MNDQRPAGHDPRGTIPKHRLGELYAALQRGAKKSFAEGMGVSPNTIRNWIEGRAYMGDLQVVRASLRLDVSVFELLDYVVTPSDVEGIEAIHAYSRETEYKHLIKPFGLRDKQYRPEFLHDMAVKTWRFLNNPDAPVLNIGYRVAEVAVMPCVFDPLEVFGHALPFTSTLVEDIDRDGSYICYPEPVYMGFGFEGIGKSSEGMGGLHWVGQPNSAPRSFVHMWQTTDPDAVTAFAKLDPERYRRAMIAAFEGIPTDFRDLEGVARAVGEVGAKTDPVYFILGVERELR